jgi:hypothetical protein
LAERLLRAVLPQHLLQRQRSDFTPAKGGQAILGFPHPEPVELGIDLIETREDAVHQFDALGRRERGKV